MVNTLPFEKRESSQRPNAVRRAGKIPAVFYGRKQKATSISIPEALFLKVLKKAGESAVVTLTDEHEEVEALIHDSDRHPVTGAFRHVDFYVFEKGQKLKIKVPIEFTGVAPAVKELGGVLVKVLHELEVEAEPKNLPQSISVDISALVSFDSIITAKEIALPPNVTLIASPLEVVASVYEPKEEVVEEAPPDLSSIEVMKKGKEVPEGEAGAVAAPEEGAKGGAKEEKK